MCGFRIVLFLGKLKFYENTTKNEVFFKLNRIEKNNEVTKQNYIGKNFVATPKH
jgi:hypothetical protein